MSLKATYQKHTLKFKFEAGTSRGKLSHHDIWVIKIWDEADPMCYGLGECAPLKGLSIDDRPDFQSFVEKTCEKINAHKLPDSIGEIYNLANNLSGFELPAIHFGLEQALLDLHNGGKHMLFENAFYTTKKSIPINGLIWMGSKDFMLEQIDSKIEAGFDCIKMKIGSISFQEECAVLQYIRDKYKANRLTLRVDANGAFHPSDALEKLKTLSTYSLHSIEQPIAACQESEMRKLCEQSPVPIVLDEELIGVNSYEDKRELLLSIQPQYIILKPSLVGGFRSCDEWIEIAESMDIAWWITSALESNIGLNAICQYTYEKSAKSHQGLGTGQLYHNNFDSPLTIEKGHVYYDADIDWDLTGLSL